MYFFFKKTFVNKYISLHSFNNGPTVWRMVLPALLSCFKTHGLHKRNIKPELPANFDVQAGEVPHRPFYKNHFF